MTILEWIEVAQRRITKAQSTLNVPASFYDIQNARDGLTDAHRILNEVKELLKKEDK